MKIFDSYRKLSWFPYNVIRKSISLNVTYSIILHNSTCYIPLDRENGVFKIINSPRNSRIKKIFFNISNYFEIIYYLYYTNRVRFTEIHTHAPPRKCIYVNQIYISGDKTFKFLVSLSIEAISSPLKLAQKRKFNIYCIFHDFYSKRFRWVRYEITFAFDERENRICTLLSFHIPLSSPQKSYTPSYPHEG